MAGSAAERYAQLEPKRQPYLDRARTCAKLTIPSLLPEDGANGSTKFTTPEQSMGARGVNNVASKLLLALLPPNAPFFKMEVDDMTAQEISGQEGAKGEVDKAFGQFTRRVMTDVEARALRSDIYEAMRLNVVSGNALLYVPEDGRARCYRLDKYVVVRDPSGNVLEIITQEQIAYGAIPEEIRGQLPPEATPATPTKEGAVQTAPSETPIRLFTHVVLNDEGQYDVYQEIEGLIIPGSEGKYLVDELPFLALRYNKVDGEDYGRGLIEEYLGDLDHLEILSKSMREFVAIASRVIPMVDPNGSTSVDKLVRAVNGQPIMGNAEDITFLQIERYNDFRVARETVDALERRLSFAFLMNTAVQRAGERVTAEEIRYMARELEDTLGGTYSVLAVDLQLPLATILIKALEKRGSLPELPKGMVNPKVVTGMDALGRGNDLSNLVQFKEIIADTPAAQTVRWEAYAQRVANSLNVETAGIVMTSEEVAQAQQAAMMQQMADKLGPNAINQIGGIAQKQMETPTA